MQNYTIGENFILPSLGKVYKKEFDPHVKLRSMTTEEEMKRISSVDEPYRNMCEIVDDCLVEGPPISSRDMCIGDYQFLLHKLRVVTYGAEYPISNTCIYCGCETRDIINLDDLPVLQYTTEFEKYKEFDLPVSGNHIILRVQTPRMLDKVTSATKEFKKKHQKELQVDPSLLYIIVNLIETIDGNIPNPLKLEDWVRQLPMKDTNTIIAHADKMNESIGIDTHLQCLCNVCGLTFNTTLRATNEFFRPSLNI